MRKSRKPLFFVAILATVALGATAVYAGFGGDKSARIKTFAKWKLADMLDDLDATDAQRAQIEPMVDPLVDSAMQRFSDREVFREELLALWQAPTADVKQAREKVFARIEAARGLAHEGIDALAEVHGVLTPAQRKMVAEEAADRARDRGKSPEAHARRAEHFAGFIVEEVVDTTDAKPAQAKQLQALADALVKRGLAEMGDHAALRADILALWGAPTADAAKAKGMLDARIDVWKGLAAEAINTAAEAHGVLDAGQRDAVADAIRKRSRRWGR